MNAEDNGVGWPSKSGYRRLPAPKNKITSPRLSASYFLYKHYMIEDIRNADVTFHFVWLCKFIVYVFEMLFVNKSLRLLRKKKSERLLHNVIIWGVFFGNFLQVFYLNETRVNDSNFLLLHPYIIIMYIFTQKLSNIYF